MSRSSSLRSSSRLMVVDDSCNLFRGEQSSHGAASHDGSPMVARSGEEGRARIVSLKHPKHGVAFNYMLIGRELCEIQRMTQPTPCSWFVDQTVHSDGSLLVASRVDPAFMLLPLLEVSSRCFSPKAQLLGSAAAELRSLAGVDDALRALCDTNEMGDADDKEVVYRLNQDKAVEYFACKARRLGATLQQQAEAGLQRMRSQMAAFSSKSENVDGGGQQAAASSTGQSSSTGATQPAATAPPASAVVPAVAGAHLATAVGILGEYLKEAWTEMIAAACKVPLTAVLPALAKKRAAEAAAATAAACRRPYSTAGDDCGDDDEDGDSLPTGYDDSDAAGAASAPKSAAPTEESPSDAQTDNAARWNAAALEDPSALINKYVRPPSGKGGDSASKKAKPAQLSIQQKKLAATNVKGMQTMASFFGKKA